MKIKDVLDAYPDGKLAGWLDDSASDDVYDIDSDKYLESLIGKESGAEIVVKRYEGDFENTHLQSVIQQSNPVDEQIKNINLELIAEEDFRYLFTTRGLASELGLSKSEVNKSLTRCLAVNLAKINRVTKKPEVNKKAFFEFIQYGLRYVFPVKPAEITRGIPTTFSAPVLNKKLLSAGDLKMVWPDSRGKEMGQAISPIYKSVPFAVRKDSELYSYLALLDAIRIGNVRESNLALKIFSEKLFNESKHV